MKFFGLFGVFKKKKKRGRSAFLIKEDLKNIDEILYKKEKHLKEVDRLDQKIILIQKSTQTTIPQFRPLHDTLRQKYKWYYNWHLSPYAKPIHVLILLFYVVSLGFALNYLIKPVTKVMAGTTYDFPRWEWANPKPTGNALKYVTTCSNNTAWAVGENGNILKSVDNGLTYSQEYSGVTDTLNSITCYNPSNIVVIGLSGRILQYDGYSWTIRAIGLTTQNLYSITVSSTGQFVVVGSNGTILYSADGTTWTLDNKPAGLTTQTLSSVTVSSTGQFVAVGGSGTILYSTDGINWALDSKPAGLTTQPLYSVTVSLVGHFVAVGDSGTILYSTDGINWALDSKPAGLITQPLYSVTVSSTGQFVAVGYNGTILYSSNGTIWTLDNKPTGLTTQTLYSVTVSSTGQFAAVSNTKVILYSTDGITWSVKAASSATYTLLSIAVFPTGQFVAVGDAGNIVYSANGITWSIKGTSLSSVQLNSVAVFSTSQFVAVGNTGTILYSADGTTWTLDNKPAGLTTQTLSSVTVSSTGQFVAVGDDGTILYSTDGTNWSIKGADLYKLTHAWLYSVTVSSTGHFVAVGDAGTILYSANGVDWSIKDASLTTERINSVTVSSTGQFVAVGDDGTILYSADGISWAVEGTSLTTEILINVTVSSTSHFVAVGENGIILYSADGTNWSLDNKPTGLTTQILQSVTVSSTGQFVTVGENGMILYSANGINWVVAGADLITEYLSSVTVSLAGNFVAVGDLGTILYSTDGTNWSIKGVGLSLGQLNSVTVSSTGQFVTVGNAGIVLHYSTPPNATATKLLVQLPGQSFADNTGIFDNPAVGTVRAGDDVPVTIYATDSDNVLDKGNASTVGFTTTDPNDTNPALIPLTKGNTCVQNRTDPSQSNCGEGTTNFNFHTAGTWTITASDTNGILTAGTSSQITVTAGPINSLSLTNFPGSLGAGTPSGPITIQAKDLYSNNTTVTSDTTVNLKTTSSVGRFSTNGSNWTTGEINLTIPAGSGSVTFYYLDLVTGNPTITATGGGFTTSASISITAGELSLSSLTLSRNSISAGESLTASVNLKNSQGVILPSKTVRLVSSREGDNTGGDQATDGNGNATFNVSATAAGSFDLIIYDVSDNVYATASATVQVTPGDLASALLTSNRRTITAGDSINLTTTLLDRFGNTLNNPNVLVGFSSSDSQSNFEQNNYWFNESGVFSQAVTLRTAGTQTINVSKSDSTLGSTMVSVNPALVSADVSTVSSDKERIDPETGVATIIVKLMDTFGNPISGKNVTITSSRLEDKITPSSSSTGDGGQANFSLSSDVSGDSIIVAQDMTDSIVLKKQLKIRIATANILDKIKESPVAQALTNILAPVSKALALLGIIPLILQILQAIPSAAPLASSVFPVLFTTASVRRRKKPWGNVFDSLTGHAVDLAVVRLYDKETDKLVSTQVTDFDGRFHFLTGTGTYYIKVEKKGYDFPVKISKFKASQLSSRFGKDSDIYLGVPFSIKNKNAQINLNIPLEPVYEKMTSKIKFRKSLKENFDWFLIGVSYVAIPLMLIGAVIAALSTVVRATRIDFVTDGAYVVLLSGFLVTSRIQKNRMGQVFDSNTREPIAGAMVTVYDSEYNAIRQTQNTDKNGNFAILAQKGEYYLLIEKKGYKFPSTKATSTKKQPIYTGGTIRKPKAGFIGVDVPLDRK